ncbi:BON domain-containing protein [Nitrosomonas sp. JL21]|uniref:BON domain-containing protein n=1 Tax=Nitrosomonas sp. JL21 TaxID=153949 RepID=UPI00136BE28E|nr:BON domain-containing protein [Nitrosomonas sp. JL21]MBL8497442.1 BON domain-containing protein [Nitrosomonas sp.]MXS78675.1 BON domain-containing protein [Nitrosomonas sp. JL21]
MKNHRLIINFLIPVVFLVACSSSSPFRQKEESDPDSVLAMNIRAKLIENKNLNAAAIQVKATDGLIVLSGFVDNEQQRKLASTITQQNPDVKKVDNKIVVK